MSAPIKPNTVLPKGAKPIKPVKKKIGGWVEMEYDAKVVRLGLVWLRIKNGMGDINDREDWVCDIPSGCISVHDYQWREPRWGFSNYKSFDEATTEQVKSQVQYRKQKAVELRKEADEADRTVIMLEAALAKGRK